jgi:hypothetical protein
MKSLNYSLVIFYLLYISAGCNNNNNSVAEYAGADTSSKLRVLNSECDHPDTNCGQSHKYGTADILPPILFLNLKDPWYEPIQPNAEVDKNSAWIIAHHMGAGEDTNAVGADVLVECSLPYNVINSKTDNIPFIEVKGINDDTNANPNADNDYDDPTGVKRIPFSEKMRMQNDRWEDDPGVENDPKNGKKDHHLIIYDKGTDILYEVYQLRKQKVGRWEWGHKGLAIFNLKSDTPRSITYHTSADAAGLAILPGLIRSEELDKEINHALRITFSSTFQGYVYPGTHYTTTGPDTGFFLPMGARLRLKKKVDESKLTLKAQRIVRCLKKYGAIVADNGTPFSVSATDDCAFNNQKDLPGYRCDRAGNSFHLCADIQFLFAVKWSDFEVMKLTNIVTPKRGTLPISDSMRIIQNKR